MTSTTEQPTLFLIAATARSTGSPHEDSVGNPVGDIWMTRVPCVDEYVEWMGHRWKVTSVAHRTWTEQNSGSGRQIPVATIELRWAGSP
jgi:hypothetical protein